MTCQVASIFPELLRGETAPFVVRLGQHSDETAQIATCVCPESHWLESWGDAEPVVGVMSLCQPTIRGWFKPVAAGMSVGLVPT